MTAAHDAKSVNVWFGFAGIGAIRGFLRGTGLWLVLALCAACTATSGGYCPMNEAADGIAKAVAAHRACKIASDCRVVDSSLSCHGTCGSAVSVSGSSAFLTEIRALDRDLCAGATCSSTPSCAPMQVTCTDDQCTAVVGLPK